MGEKYYTHRLCVSRHTKERLKSIVIPEMKRRNSSLKKVNVTEGFAVMWLIDAYLEG